MSRRPSATSNSPLTSSAAHSHEISPFRDTSGSAATFSDSPNTYPNGHSSLDPDELFTKHTILEVKVAQQKLREDADAKQEELRLMVGERYRDLIQASTSIISLARSSQRVSEALDEVHNAILSQKDPPIPRQTSSLSTSDDKHLHSLQSLAAHMKLLLDTPEHLWRFIERKKYLQAAWLFLLARVVHRALMQNNDQDEGSWTEQGIDVLSEFPLVERQWEIVSQFRSQIIHKATLSLREMETSPEEVCSTLVTLHLLDSRPLSETFSTMLSQRSRALRAALHRGSDQNSASSRNQSLTTRDAKNAIEKAVIVISRTVGTSRGVFAEDDSFPSMIKQVLMFIHSDSTDSIESGSDLPSELRLTTQSLLATLTSSAQLSLLPPSLTTYRPYVDIKSSTSTVSATDLSQKLDAWLRGSVEKFQKCAQEWLLNVNIVRDIWNIRTSTRQLAWRSEMSEPEKLQLLSVLDNSYQERIIAIWESMLLESSSNFSEHLTKSISFFKGGSSEEMGDNLFVVPSLPSSPFVSSNAASGGLAFQKYAATLKKQLIGRTNLLDGILSILEQCAKTIQQDLSEISKVDDESTLELSKTLIRNHQPSADAISKKVLESINTLAGDVTEDNSSAIDELAFLTHITHELSTSSTFISCVGCSEVGISEFKHDAISVYNRIIDRWRSLVVVKCILEVSYSRQTAPTTTISGPSPQMVQALLALCQAILRLGLSRDSIQRRELARSSLSSFASNWLEKGGSGDKQKLFDNLFLRRLMDTQRSSDSGNYDSLGTQADADVWSTEEQEEVENVITNYLSRTRTLFATLSPIFQETKRGYDMSAFRTVQHETAPSDQTLESALELAKPSPRFGLLLVGSSKG